jgi:hypothetical protein
LWNLQVTLKFELPDDAIDEFQIQFKACELPRRSSQMNPFFNIISNTADDATQSIVPDTTITKLSSPLHPHSLPQNHSYCTVDEDSRSENGYNDFEGLPRAAHCEFPQQMHLTTFGHLSQQLMQQDQMQILLPHVPHQPLYENTQAESRVPHYETSLKTGSLTNSFHTSAPYDGTLAATERNHAQAGHVAGHT